MWWALICPACSEGQSVELDETGDGTFTCTNCGRYIEVADGDPYDPFEDEEFEDEGFRLW
jgi:transcription elongation factor Elf1